MGENKGKGSGGGGTSLGPGVYIEEVPSGSKPIEGVGTSTAAFVGLDEPETSSGWRRTGALLILVAAAAAAVFAWRHWAGRQDDGGSPQTP